MIPAFKSRISSLDDSDRNLSAARFTESREVRSMSRILMSTGSTRSHLIDVTAAAARLGSRAASQISFGLCLASSTMDCFPRPLLPPVTMMTLPFREGMSVEGVNVVLVEVNIFALVFICLDRMGDC